MKSAVITGPTGSIGTALIEHLISNGIEVLAIIRPDSKRTDNIPAHPLVTKLKLNLNELDKVPNYLDGKNYDVFIILDGMEPLEIQEITCKDNSRIYNIHWMR